MNSWIILIHSLRLRLVTIWQYELLYHMSTNYYYTTYTYIYIYIQYNDYNIYIYIIIGWNFRCLNTSFPQPCELKGQKQGLECKPVARKKASIFRKKPELRTGKMKSHYHSNTPRKKGSPKGHTSWKTRNQRTTKRKLQTLLPALKNSKVCDVVFPISSMIGLFCIEVTDSKVMFFIPCHSFNLRTTLWE